MIQETEALQRAAALLGETAMQQLARSHVAVFGVGGVGGYALEALVRGGIGEVTVIDHDVFHSGNLNRQILATVDTLGRKKVEVACERAQSIRPSIRIHPIDLFATAENLPALLESVSPDYIIDAIDSVPSKTALIALAKEKNIPIVSSMGTGNHLDPFAFTITDLQKTHTCPLARVMRRKLQEVGIKHVDVLFSREPPVTPAEPIVEEGRSLPGSVSFVPSVAGLMLGGYVLKQLCSSQKQ